MISTPDLQAAYEAAIEENRRLRAELESMHQAARAHAALLDNAPLLISTKDLQGNILSANRHFEVLDGYDAATFVGSNVFKVFPPDIAAQLWRNDQRAALERRAIHEEETVFHCDKTAHTYATVKFPLLDSEGHVTGTCAVSSDITATRYAQVASITDELTGLKNRRYFNMRFMEEQRRAHRDGRTLTLMLADVDRFKQYNDNYGHPRGDSLLAAVACTITETFGRTSDLAFRIGGDEFACLFSTNGELESIDLAERLRMEIGALRLPHVDNQPFGHVTLSLGLFFITPAMELSLEHAYEAADQALYRAKHNGRNSVSR